MPTILMSYVALLILVLNAANAFRGPWASSIETTTRTPSSPHVKMEPDPKLSSTMANFTPAPAPPSPPPPPPASPAPPPAQPSVVDGIPQHNNPRCATPSQGIPDIELEKGATIASFDKEVMRKLYTKMCDDGKTYVLEKHEDHSKVRLVAYSHPVGGGTGPQWDPKWCAQYFSDVMDNCKFFPLFGTHPRHV
ncbi:MAG: hypothetical protein LQ352_004736 [Teloschistes flavicans]|nr:MAG: hypothetical protein LQ352_004736 [Teloschistes flavicans]